MIILPLHPAENATQAGLQTYLEQCRAAARRDRHFKLASISLEVGALDPLAVLESIFEPHEPHFDAERPAIQSAIAGAEIAVAYESKGASRFASCRARSARSPA